MPPSVKLEGPFADQPPMNSTSCRYREPNAFVGSRCRLLVGTGCSRSRSRHYVPAPVRVHPLAINRLRIVLLTTCTYRPGEPARLPAPAPSTGWPTIAHPPLAPDHVVVRLNTEWKAEALLEPVAGETGGEGILSHDQVGTLLSMDFGGELIGIPGETPGSR